MTTTASVRRVLTATLAVAALTAVPAAAATPCGRHRRAGRSGVLSP